MNKTYAAFVAIIAIAFAVPNMAAARKILSEDIDLNASGFTYLPSNTTDIQKLADRVDVALASGAGGVETDPVFGLSAAKGITSGNITAWDVAYSHVSNTTNPHNVTKTQIGLGNVDNTSDANKPISSATQTALNAKQDTLTLGNVTAGTGVSVTGGTGAIIGTGLTVTNTAPDQTVSITGGGITSISGTYPSFTATSTEADTFASVTGRGATTTVNIGTSGNIGAGTTTPTSTLDVNGTAKMTGFKLGTSTTSGYVLTADSSGVGTWQASSGGFADPMTTRGDLIYRNASNQTARLPIGASTYVLTSNGTDVSWSAPTGGGMTYPGAGIAVSTGSAWGTSLTDNSTNWNTAYGWGNHGTAGYLTAEVDGSTTNELPLAGSDIDVSGQTVSVEETLDSVVKINQLSELAFDVTPTTTAASEGKMYWSAAEGTLEFDVTDGSISVNKEIFEYYTNLSGGNLVEGDVVSIVGVSGGRSAVSLTDATNNTSVENCIGVVTTTGPVANNGVVRVTTHGTVNMGTGVYTEAPVYVNPASPGKWTQTKPDAPNFTVQIGTIKVAHASAGKLEVNIWKNCKFVDAADVNGTPLTASGQIAVWNQAAKYFDFTDNINNYATTTVVSGKQSMHGVVARSTVPGANVLPTNLTTTTFTLGATANPISYYFAGTLVNVTSDKTATLDDGAGGSTAGLYFVYFNGTTGNILATKTFPGISCGDNVIIATVFWNGTNYGLVSDERHAYRRDCEWHTWAHQTVGARYKSGFDFVPTGTAATATFTMSGGLIYDEDIAFTAPASSSYPTPNALRTLYQTGATTYAFDATTSTIPYKAGTGSRPTYVNGTTYALTTMSSATNRYINFFIYATTDLHTPVYCVAETLPAAVVATNGYTSTANARAVPFPNLAGFGLSPEMRPLYRLVVRADGQVQAITSADDYRTVSSLPMGAGTTSTTASAVSSLAYGTVASTNVQGAIEELADEKVQIVGGNVGVGTATPAYPLEVTGTASVGSLRVDSNTINLSDTTDEYVLAFDTTTNTWRGVASASGFADPMTTRGDIIVRNASNTTARLPVGANTYVLTSDGTDVAWAAPSEGATSWTVSGSDQYASTSGNVGIGSATPTEKLDVVGSIKASGNVSAAYVSGNGSQLTGLGGSIGLTVDGGDAVITTGTKASLYVPYACTINSVTMTSDTTGSVVVDIKRSTYSGYPTTSSIVASAKPTISSAQKSTDTTLTGWTTSLAAGDVLEFVVDSATTIKKVTLVLKVTK